MNKISACLVVYNEGKVIERCLESIKNLVDEIIIVHDGECTDRTLDIAKKYTDNIFIRDHIGEAEPHRVFSFEKATGDWIFQIDADEYIDKNDIPKIKELVQGEAVNGYFFKWELWNGKHTIVFDGLLKLVLFTKKYASFIGIPHESVKIKGTVIKTEIMLHHRPQYSNVSWLTFFRKTKKWNAIHANYFFPEKTIIHTFQTNLDDWQIYTQKVRKHPVFYMFWESFKILFGQLKNGQIFSRWGVIVALQQFVRIFMTYFHVARIVINKKLKNFS